jgi:Uncharacterized membrane protein (homolog of Drosophila rhomboid)
MSRPELPEQDPDAAPFNPIPPAVVALVAVILGIEVLFTLGARGLIGDATAVGWRLGAIQDWGYIDAVFEWMRETGRWEPEQVARFLTYPLLHLGFTHALFVIVFILAIGKIVAEVFGNLAFLVIFWLSAVLGALAYGLILNEEAALVGGYPGVYGLIGAFTFMMWSDLTEMGENRARAFVLIGVLLSVQLVFSLAFGGTNQWVADLSGFAVGFAASFLFVPGALKRLLDRLRQR